MALLEKIIKKSPKHSPSKKNYEDNPDLKKLKVYVVIVNRGHANAVSSLLKKNGSPVQYISVGNGTASKTVLDILGFVENSKDVVLALIKEELIDEVKKELEAYFAASKKNKGIGFSIDMTSIIGVKFYRFIADTL